MVALPWIAPNPSDGHHEAVVMASRLEVASRLHVPRFFWKSLIAWRQLGKAPGVLGASLDADLLDGVFWTLSAWTGEDTLSAYARSQPHRAIMRDLRPTMRDSNFVYWKVRTSELPIAWHDARRRITQARAERVEGLPS